MASGSHMREQLQNLAGDHMSLCLGRGWGLPSRHSQAWLCVSKGLELWVGLWVPRQDKKARAPLSLVVTPSHFSCSPRPGGWDLESEYLWICKAFRPSAFLISGRDRRPCFREPHGWANPEKHGAADLGGLPAKCEHRSWSQLPPPCPQLALGTGACLHGRHSLCGISTLLCEEEMEIEKHKCSSPQN